MFRAWDWTSSSAHARSGCAADARALPCAGPLCQHRVLGPPERRALRRPAPGRLATADAAPASQPQGGGPVEPRVRRLVGTAVEAARPEAPSLGRRGSGLPPPHPGATGSSRGSWRLASGRTSRHAPQGPSHQACRLSHQVEAHLAGHDAHRNAGRPRHTGAHVRPTIAAPDVRIAR